MNAHNTKAAMIGFGIIAGMLAHTSGAVSIDIDGRLANSTETCDLEWGDNSGLSDTSGSNPVGSNMPPPVSDEDGTVTLTVSPNIQDWRTGFSTGSYDPGEEWNIRSSATATTAAGAFTQGAFIEIRLNSAVNGWELITLNSVDVSLWRNGSGADTHFQLAIDADGDGFTTNDLVGAAVTPAAGIAGDTTLSYTGASLPTNTTEGIVRLYHWGKSSKDGNMHLYDVAVDYTVDAVVEGPLQYFSDSLQEESSVTNQFNPSSLQAEGYWYFSTNAVIPVRDTTDWPTNAASTVLRTNFLAGASTMSTSTTSDGGEGRSTLCTKFGSYSSSSWKAHVAIETPTAGDPVQNYLFFGLGQNPDSGDRAYVRMQYGGGGSGLPRFYVNGSVADSWGSAVTAPGMDVYLTHNVDTGVLVAEFDAWASDGTRSNGVDFTLVADISSLSFNADTEAGIFFTAQSTVTFSDFRVEEYTPTAPTIPLNLYAWPDLPDSVTVRWDEESLSSGGYNVYRSVGDESAYVRIASGVMDTSYADTDVTNGVTYYYQVAGTNGFGEGPVSTSEFAVPNPYLIIGSEASQVDKSKYELFDGDLDTLFGLNAAGYAGLDYGEGNEQQLVKIRYYLRNDAWGNYDGGLRAVIRSAGCMFQGANSADFSDAVTLYTLTTNNTVMAEWNEFSVTNATAFRYVRFQTGGSFNKINTMAELDFIKTTDFTVNGTPKYWLDRYYDVLAEFGGDYDAADLSDTDGDGLRAWEEQVAGTDPTDDLSALLITGGSSTESGLVLTWQSVAGKSYSIVTNTSLTTPSKGTAVSGIAGMEGETSYTTTVSSAGTVFYEIGVE
ncbi:hypothetical protein [Pontiella sp.]|uniref:hypothetical protein n=1 Tax=Pontiella sp. TaxID=2837462 RepID=UPI0035636F09